MAVYEGESGRPVVTRLCEHINALKSNNAENPLVKHLEKDHKENKNKVTFAFETTERFRDPLTRQADEGLRIEASAKLGKILNSKSEFHHPPI